MMTVNDDTPARVALSAPLAEGPQHDSWTNFLGGVELTRVLLEHYRNVVLDWICEAIRLAHKFAGLPAIHDWALT